MNQENLNPQDEELVPAVSGGGGNPPVKPKADEDQTQASEPTIEPAVSGGGGNPPVKS